MGERTMINVEKDSHRIAREEKEKTDDTWSDVLEAYAVARPHLSRVDGEFKLDIDDIDECAEVENLTERVEDAIERIEAVEE